MCFGERLKQVRKSTGLNQADFARQLGISRNPIASAETGKSRLYTATIHKICDLYGINEKWLIDGEGQMKNTFGVPQDEIKQLLETYSKLPEPSRKKFLALLEELTIK